MIARCRFATSRCPRTGPTTATSPPRPATPTRCWPIFAREGWKAEKAQNGPPHAGFSLVRGWIENQTAIEIGGSDMRQEYERFFAEVVQRAA